MPIRRARALCALVLALAALLSGCVEITNPQFDARYRIAVRPVGKPGMAVFAVRLSPNDIGLPSGDRASILVVDTAKGASVATIPLEGVVRLSDVGGADRPRLLATLPDGFAEVDLVSREVTRVPTAALPHGRPVGASFDASGVPVFWQAADGDLRLLISRGTGAEEETATIDFRTAFRGKTARPAGLAAWSLSSMSLTSADASAAYFVNDSPAPYGDPTLPPAALERTVTSWRADFADHTMWQTGEMQPWPPGLSSPNTRTEWRPLARFGPPVALTGGIAGFLVRRTAESSPEVSVLPTSPVVFEPGGERYLQVRQQPTRSAVEWTVVERSLVSTRTSNVYREEIPAAEGLTVEPLGVVGGRFAYAEKVPYAARAAESTPGAGGYGAYDLHLYDTVTRVDVVAASVPVHARSLVTIDYLGSFTR